MLKLKFQYFCPPDVKSWLTGKDPDSGKDWGQEENGTTEDEMVGWHHQLSGQVFEQTPGDTEGQGSLACCSPWGCKESDMTWGLNNNNIVHRGFSGGTMEKNPAVYAGECSRRGFNFWVRKIPGAGNGNPLQFSCLGNPRDRGAWWASVHGVTKSRTELRDWAGTHSSQIISKSLELQQKESSI